LARYTLNLPSTLSTFRRLIQTTGGPTRYLCIQYIIIQHELPNAQAICFYFSGRRRKERKNESVADSEPLWEHTDGSVTHSHY